MANKHENLTVLFSDIADAIRSKTGESGVIVADNFPSAISGIQTPNLQAKTVTPTTSSQTVKPDNNYNGLSQVTVNAMPTATQATPSISVSSAGLITASATQTAGYVTAGTKSATKQLTTQAAKTVTPTENSQTAVASGVYTTGAVTVGAIPSQYIVPNGTKEITENGTYDIASFAEAIVNVAGSGGGGGGYEGDYYSYGTATAKPASGATSAQFTNIPKQPDFFICYVDTFNVEQYHRAGVVVYDGETVYGQEIYSGTDDCYLRENTNTASSYYYKFSYSGTTLTLSSAGTNNGGYFHNPGVYTLIYAYKDNENGTVAIGKKKVTATAGTSLSFTELEGEPVWYSAILKANQDAQAGSTSTVMYVNENGCTRMGNASSRAPYTFTAATGLGTYADGTLTLTPGSAEFAAKEYTLIYAYVPDFGGFEIFDIELPFGRMRGDVDGDGRVSSIDANTILNIAGGKEAAPSDEIAFWCADFDGDGDISSMDYSLCSRFSNKLPSSYIAEYYGNWTWLQEGDFGYFYRDIPVEGMTKDSTAILAVQKSAELFQVPECFDGFLRIKATYCPATNVKATVFWKKHETIKSKPIGEPVDLSCTLKIVDNSDGSGYFEVYYQKEAGVAPDFQDVAGEYKALSKGLLYVYKEDLSVSYANATKVYSTLRYIDVEPGGVCTVTFS